MLIGLIIINLILLTFGDDEKVKCGNGESCFHGKCVSGMCRCDDCYTGPTCQLIKNKKPIFSKSTYHVVIIQRTVLKNSVISNAIKANDEDQCSQENGSCGCTKILYEFLEKSDSFIIENTTGIIRNSKELISDQLAQNIFIFTIKAFNSPPFDNQYDTATVEVVFNSDTTKESDIPLQRFRRAVAAPQKPTFKLTQTYPSFNLTTIKFGQKLEFQLAITFPQANNSMTVEIFAPETTNKAAMMLCDISHTIGSEITNLPVADPLKEGKGSSVWPYTRIVYNLYGFNHPKSVVDNEPDIQMIIKFTAVMLFEPEVTGATYYVSAGAEYLSGAEIWVGQAGYTADISVVEPTPNITLSGDNELYPGYTSTFDIDILAKDVYIGVDMELYTPLNDTSVLSICSANRVYQGSAFGCLPISLFQPVLTEKIISGKKRYTKATMNLGFLTNMFFLDGTVTDPNSSIKVRMALRTNPLAWIGDTFYVGVAITHVKDKIWTGKKSLIMKQKPTLSAYSGSIVSSLDYINSVNTAKLGNTESLVLKLTAPKGSVLDYTIKVKSPGEKIDICGVSVIRAGVNLPCISQIEPKTNFTLSTKSTIIEYFSIFEAIRHIEFSNETKEDELELKILFRVVNDTSYIASGVTVTAQLFWNGGQSIEFTKAFSIQTFDVIPEIATNDLPTFTFETSSTNVAVDLSYIMKLNVLLKPGIIYSPVTLEFFLPYNDTMARMKFCNFIFKTVGKNVLCFNKDAMIKKLKMISRANNGTNYDKIQLDVGTLCTSTTVGTTATSEDSFEIWLYFKVLEHPMNTISSKCFVNVGMIISSSQIWVGSKELTIVAIPTPAAVDSGNIPLLFGSRTDDSTNVFYKNDIVIIQYLIKVNVNFFYNLKLKISSDLTITDQFSVCYIRIIKSTSNIPCLEGKLSFVKWGDYSKFNKEAVFEMNVFNFGNETFNTNQGYDDNSILIEAGVKFGDVSIAAKIKAELIYYNTDKKDFEISLTFNNLPTRFNGTNPLSEPTFNLQMYELFNDTIIPNVSKVAFGETLRSVVSVQLRPNSLQSLKILFSSRPNTMAQMDIFSVNIIKVGKNIPCFNLGMLTFSVETRAGSPSRDMTGLDLGTICHRELVTGTDDEENKIYIEALFTVWKKPPLPLPGDIDINVIGLLNNDQVYITKITILTTIDVDHIDSLNINNLTPTAEAQYNGGSVDIGSTFTINLTITIPPFLQTKNAKFHIFPLHSSDSSFISLSPDTNAGASNVTTVTYGEHFGYNSSDSLLISKVSSTNSSQIDHPIIELGILQNLGTKYRLNQLNYTAGSDLDKISMIVTLRISDHKEAVTGKIINIPVGLDLSGTFINSSFSVTINRPASLTIDLETTTQLLSTLSVYRENEDIEISTYVSLKNGSSLECRDMLIIVATPEYVNFKSLTNSSYTSPGYSIEQTVLPSKGIQFKVPYFFFTEHLYVVFKATLSPNTVLTRKRQTALSTLPVIYTCKKAFDSIWINKVDDVTLTLRGNDINIAGESCNTDLKVTDSAEIKNCGIRAFMSPFVGFEGVNVRSNSGAMWKPHIRGGHYDRFRYIDIVIGKMKKITKLIITSTTTNKPKTIDIFGTMDGRSYGYYQTIVISFVGNVANALLSNPSFIYRGIRVAIVSTEQNDTETGINIDLNGCDPTFTDTNIFDPCTVVSKAGPPYSTSKLSDYYVRGYLHAEPHLFVCDYMPVLSLSPALQQKSNLHIYPRCLRTTTTNPTIWKDMGPKVGRIVGFNETTNHIYAIAANDMNSYILSEDDGKTWFAINELGWKMTTIVDNMVNKHKEIPWTIESGFMPNETAASCSKYTSGSWKFCYDGVYLNTVKHLSWNDCCTL